MKAVSAAIYASPLNLAPQPSGAATLRVPVPRPDLDKRQQYIRDAQALCEKARNTIRAHRIDGQKDIKRDVDDKVVGTSEARTEGKKVREVAFSLSFVGWRKAHSGWGFAAARRRDQEKDGRSGQDFRRRKESVSARSLMDVARIAPADWSSMQSVGPVENAQCTAQSGPVSVSRLSKGLLPDNPFELAERLLSPLNTVKRELPGSSSFTFFHGMEPAPRSSSTLRRLSISGCSISRPSRLFSVL